MAIINHPPHIVDDEMKISPSAFIPYCMFGGDMSIMGVKIEEFEFSVCNSFQAKILSDQLCYEVDLNRYIGNTTQERNRQLAEGFVMLIDINQELKVYCSEFFPLASNFHVVD